MMLPLLHLLAQIDSTKLPNDGSPTLPDSPSFGMTWVIALLLSAGILLVTFKTSKRNHMDRG
jgi:hypothetical protein